MSLGFVSRCPYYWNNKLIFKSALSTFVVRNFIVNPTADNPIPTLMRDQPREFDHIFLSYQLCAGRARARASSSVSKHDVEEGLWSSNLPAEYRWVNPDTRWDETHRFVVWQRAYLRDFFYAGRSTILKIVMNGLRIRGRVQADIPTIKLLGDLSASVRDGDTNTRLDLKVPLCLSLTLSALMLYY